jgi:excisionase family DNA binding protein
MEQKPLTTGEIAKLCHVSLRTALIWVEEGKLKAYQTPGGHNRIRTEDFISFLKKFNMPIPAAFSGMDVKKKILVVDDDKNFANSIKRILRAEKRFEIETAFDGFDAGAKLLEFKPDLVVLDIRMPGLDGYEVARRIKQSREGERIRMIAMSAYFKEDGKKKILDIGADACLDKPFENGELLEKINELV